MKATFRVRLLSAFFIATLLLVSGYLGQATPDEPEKPKNLKVLPKDISHDDLIKIMRGFTASLGVKCGECHVGTPTADGKMDFDFASDAKDEKLNARKMMKMVDAINGKYLGKMDNDFEKITCVTCHRGHIKPMVSIDSLPKQEKH
jgi:hypothetical protein